MSLTQLPDKIFAGAPLQIIETNALYPASDGWTLKYVLINANNKIQIISTPSGENHLINLTSAITKEYASGNFTYQKYFSKEADVAVVGNGAVEVVPFLAEQETFDARTEAQIILDLLQEALKNMAGKPQVEIQFPTGAVEKYNRSALMDDIERYQAIVARESKTVQSGILRSRF